MKDSLLKSSLLQTYYHATVLPRRLWNAWQARRGRAPIVMVYYHRVADDGANRWTISNVLFERQMRFLLRNFELISLEETQRRMRSGRNDRLAAHVTFDDGYADNNEFALPLMLRERIPFTYYINSRQILEQLPFPHDVRNRRPLAPNTPDDIRALIDAGVEIGAHTRSHANLGVVRDPQQLYDEVIGCKDDLEGAFGVRVRSFAFPFGLHEHLNADAFRLARDHGIDSVCSAYGGYNYPGGDAFHLHRFDGTPIDVQFRNWMMVDPLKERRVRRFVYQHAMNGPDLCRVAEKAVVPE